ncbi:hypothetical protein H310_10929 [Aphanomyces invadans]|uniref:RNase III domain-containing protein n=1 Tax=Aphanomyces invadans TaxID=157072 RepID=A0A024TQL9_9STRA|nr:hypothetical protein H310_10929 [Aphanomyces invadans]ETV95891.1 hypothetical protein H310_10929 [Aphanomyces invadans]|eukprot:XP_008875642.1 hypothetical protein H310_10929 [Aphanomyces invadans]
MVKAAPRKRNGMKSRVAGTHKSKTNRAQKHVKVKFQPARSSSPRTPDPNKNENEVFEWVGDAVLDELVGRSLLRHVHIFYSRHDSSTDESSRDGAPRVSNLDLFRQLRSSLVSNSNLCAVYDKLFPPRFTILVNPLKLKQKADAVETLVGRISSRHRKSPKDLHQLDLILSMMLEVEFTHWAVEQEQIERKSFNQFSLLEHLIDTEDETDEAATAAATDQAVPSPPSSSSNSFDNASSPTAPFHAFAAGPSGNAALHTTPDSLPSVAQLHSWAQALHDSSHILQSSRVTFEVFKLYGMSVMKERISTFLVQDRSATLSAMGPADLTWIRQSILSIDREAHCASLLSVVARGGETSAKLQANTLRAVVGFASAVNCPWVVDAVCGLLVYLHQSPASCLAAGGGCALGTMQTTTHMDLDDLALHEVSTCPNSVATFMATRWRGRLPAVTSLANMPRSVAATIEFLHRRHLPWENSLEIVNQWLPSRWCDLDPFAPSFESQRRKRQRDDPVVNASDATCRKTHSTFALLQRFSHRRFLYSLEALIISFAQYDTAACRLHLREAAADLEPCIDDLGVCTVSDVCLSLVFKDSFYRLLMHELVHFHSLDAKSHTKPHGTMRVMQIRRPKGYVWQENVYTNEATAIVE